MNLAERIKRYEAATNKNLMPQTPVIIRVDGRAFHTLLRSAEKPYDPHFMMAMVESANFVAKQMSLFKAAYIQSDEVTFCLTDNDKVESDGWFGYDHSKLVSITAAAMTAKFQEFYPGKYPMFDARAFSVPTHDVPNVFLWRATDWYRNSVQMLAQSVFSHKQLHKKSMTDIHNMLHKKDINWSRDTPSAFKNGVYLVKGDGGIDLRTDVTPSYPAICKLLTEVMPQDFM